MNFWFTGFSSLASGVTAHIGIGDLGVGANWNLRDCQFHSARLDVFSASSYDFPASTWNITNCLFDATSVSLYGGPSAAFVRHADVTKALIINAFIVRNVFFIPSFIVSTQYFPTIEKPTGSFESSMIFVITSGGLLYWRDLRTTLYLVCNAAQPAIRIPPMRVDEAPQTGHAKRSAIAMISLAVVVLAVAHNCWLAVTSGSFVRETLRSLHSGNNKFIEENAQVDMLPANQAGNIFLQFEDFPEGENEFTSTTYCRMVYSVYPRKVYAARPSSLINRGADLLKNPFKPDDAWLDKNKVGEIIIFKRESDGGVSFQKIPRLLH